MKKDRLMLLGIAALLTGCAGSVHRGVVAMKVSDTAAHVCVGKEEVKVGDKLALYRNECRKGSMGSKAKKTTCTKEKLGTGTVTEILNEHYSVVEVQSGVQFREGDVVEREHG